MMKQSSAPSIINHLSAKYLGLALSFLTVFTGVVLHAAAASSLTLEGVVAEALANSPRIQATQAAHVQETAAVLVGAEAESIEKPGASWDGSWGWGNPLKLSFMFPATTTGSLPPPLMKRSTV
jgi:hypothetical protein